MKYLGNTGLTKLIALINEKFAPLNSPAITGVPTAPTAAAGTNTTQLATTAFVHSALSNITPVIISDDEEMPAAVNNDGLWFQLTGDTSIPPAMPDGLIESALVDPAIYKVEEEEWYEYSGYFSEKYIAALAIGGQSLIEQNSGSSIHTTGKEVGSVGKYIDSGGFFYDADTSGVRSKLVLSEILDSSVFLNIIAIDRNRSYYADGLMFAVKNERLGQGIKRADDIYEYSYYSLESYNLLGTPYLFFISSSELSSEDLETIIRAQYPDVANILSLN